MTDDVGFGAASTFGGPIETPTFDELAEVGLRYNAFHTAAICSPTRASLLTGRSPHTVGMGYVSNWATPYEGYTSRIPENAATVAHILRDNGYNTAMFGKGHITPEWEMSAAGPFDRWPTGLGFEYFYGFLGADTSQFEPNLIENTRPTTPDTNAAGYHLDRDLADQAIAWLNEQSAAAPDKPFFIYYAPGTAHAPNHAPPEWIARFHGRFDAGWDVMRKATIARQKELGVVPKSADDAPRPEGLPLWEDLPPEERALYARYMEAYAASLAYADHQIGRVITALRERGRYENTLIIYIQGDNGASAEGRTSGKIYEQSALNGVQETLEYALAQRENIGGASSYTLNPGGWGWAMNAPFPWAKRYAAHLGGARNGLVMSWPEHFSNDNQVRSQFHHVSDIVPTILEAAGINAPSSRAGVPQLPFDGVSMAYTFGDADAPDRRLAQVFAVGLEFGLYFDDWMVVAEVLDNPWRPGPAHHTEIDARAWELYDLSSDFSQAHNIADANPKKLAQMRDLFWIEAGRHNILPIHSSSGGQDNRPDPARNRDSFTYLAPTTHIPESAAPHIIGRSFTISAEVNIPEGDAEGVIVAHGGRFAGYALHLSEGVPTFTYNLTPAHITRVWADAPLTPGQHTLVADFQIDEAVKGAGGMVSIQIDGRRVSSGRIERTFPLIVSHTEGFDIGSDAVTAVDDEYLVENSAFSGEIRRVDITLR